MGGFNYGGGKGDGTGWSSERGTVLRQVVALMARVAVRMIAMMPKLPVGM